MAQRSAARSGTSHGAGRSLPGRDRPPGPGHGPARHGSRAARASGWCRNRTRRRGCVATLVVLTGFFAEQFSGIELEPGFDALASTRWATASISSTVRGCSSPLSLWVKKGIGTPQLRWREMHTSRAGRRSLPCSRAWPQAGRTGSARWRPGNARAGWRPRWAACPCDEPLGGGAIDHGVLWRQQCM